MLLFDRELLLYNTIFWGNMKNNINKLLLITISIVFLTFSILTPSISAETYTKEIQNSENLQTKITYGYADEENSSFIITEEITTLSLKEALDSWIKSGNDKNASYELLPFDPSELENIPNITANFLPEYTFLLNYTAEDGSIQQIKYYIKSEIGEYVDDSEKFQTYAVDTIFDIAAFSISLNEYKKNKTFWNGFWVVTDAAAVVFPGIPAVSGVKRMIEGSTTVLKPALSKGVRRYSSLQKISPPKNYRAKGWERHHIIEKRFASNLNTTSGRMLSIFIPKYHYHYQITQKMRKKIPYQLEKSRTKNQIMQAHIDAYGELWAESGFADEYWEFLYKFAKTKQYD